jgi:hypothetical protein
MKKDKLKKLIQSVDLDQPKADFTDSIMKKIELQESLIINPVLDALLEKHLIEMPSVDFTQKVITGIESSDKKVVYESIISKKTWYGVGMAAALIVTLVGFLGHPSQTAAKPHLLTNLINQITGRIISQVSGLSALVLACLFGVSALLLLDYFFSGKENYQIEQ